MFKTLSLFQSNISLQKPINRISCKKDLEKKTTKYYPILHKSFQDENRRKVREINRKLSAIEASGGRLDQIKRDLRRKVWHLPPS